MTSVVLCAQSTLVIERLAGAAASAIQRQVAPAPADRASVARAASRERARAFILPPPNESVPDAVALAMRPRRRIRFARCQRCSGCDRPLRRVVIAVTPCPSSELLDGRAGDRSREPFDAVVSVSSVSDVRSVDERRWPQGSSWLEAPVSTGAITAQLFTPVTRATGPRAVWPMAASLVDRHQRRMSQRSQI